MKENENVPPDTIQGEYQNKTVNEEESEGVGHSPENINDDNPEWDGSEAELVADDDAEEYEIPETGIKLSYTLTREEMFRCLYRSNMYKTKGNRAYAQTIVFVLASAAFFLTYFLTDSPYNGYNLFFGFFCIAMIVLIWVVPRIHMKHLSKIMTDGKTIEAEIYPARIDIGTGEGAWSIELDGTVTLHEFDNILMLSDEDGRNFAIPERVIEPELFNEIKAILVSGTMPS